MDFIRRERVRPDYDVNTKHCIMGQDGDWIMLGLATHEPNLVLLREQVVFDAKKQAILEANGISSYIHNPNFEWLHMSILRDYLAYEFETREVVPSSKYDLEATIDDFVFLTFFVGNDFLPHCMFVMAGLYTFTLQLSIIHSHVLSLSFHFSTGTGYRRRGL